MRIRGGYLRSRARCIALLLAVVAAPATAQWLTQDIPLVPGWNGVHLLVRPAERACGVLFSNTPIEKVCWWQRRGLGMEFGSDPADPFPRAADWQLWYATNPVISTFGDLLAGESYEIFVATNAAPFTLRIKGTPVLSTVEWVPGEANLTGLPVPTNVFISFGEFFSFSPDFAVNSSTATVFRVAGTSNASQRIWNPATSWIRRGEAYWIEAGAGAWDYNGPIRVTCNSSSRLLDFGASLAPQSLVIENVTDTNRTVQIVHLASESPPDYPEFPSSLGRVPLLFKGTAFDDEYRALPDVLTTNIAAGRSLELLLMPDPQSIGGGTPGAAWQSVIRVTDPGNVRFPVATVDASAGVSLDGAISAEFDPAGLWVGSVRVTDVERAPTREGVTTNYWAADGPVPVSQPYTFRLILHVDSHGTTRLLQRALMAWRPVPNPEGAGSELSTNGVFEILTDESEALAYADAHADAKIVRISSVCFPLMTPVDMAGAFGASNTLSCTVTIPYDDPVNPFVHTYHPQHDNLRYDNGTASKLREGVESYTVTRVMDLHFEPVDPDRGAANPAWGVTEVGGRFEETVDGLNKEIGVKGTFRLERISRIGTLGASAD